MSIDQSCGIRRGDIRNSEYAWKAKQYSWSKLCPLLPRNISPTDVDASVEVDGNFLFVEFKTYGTVLQDGQRLYFERLLDMSRLSGTLFILEHERLEDVNVETDIRRMQIWYWEDTKHAIAKVAPFVCFDNSVAWWLEQWALHSLERPNNFKRALREILGVYPVSKTQPYKRAGGELCYPPFSIWEADSRKEYLSPYISRITVGDRYQ